MRMGTSTTWLTQLMINNTRMSSLYKSYTSGRFLLLNIQRERENKLYFKTLINYHLIKRISAQVFRIINISGIRKIHWNYKMRSLDLIKSLKSNVARFLNLNLGIKHHFVHLIWKMYISSSKKNRRIVVFGDKELSAMVFPLKKLLSKDR